MQRSHADLPSRAEFEKARPVNAMSPVEPSPPHRLSALQHLDEFGYAVIATEMRQDEIALLRDRLIMLAHAERRIPGRWASARKLHVEDVLAVTTCADPLAASSGLLGAAHGMLGADVYVHGVRMRAPLPGHGQQSLHTDDLPGTGLRLLTAIVPLIDIDSTNGAPRVVPRSHLRRPDVLPEDESGSVANQLVLNCPAGSAIVFGGGLWHSGTRNDSEAPRPAVAITFAQRHAGLPHPRRNDARAHSTDPRLYSPI